MTGKKFHRGGVVHVAPGPLIRAVDGEAIDRMNEGSVTITVTNALPADRRVEDAVRAALGSRWRRDE